MPKGKKASDFATLEKKLEYKFKNKDLLKQALTHNSFGKPNYQPLEFLGDALLGFLVAKLLHEWHPDSSEGYLTTSRSEVVKNTNLAEYAEYLGIPDLLITAKTKNQESIKSQMKVRADAMEAVFAAMYLDGGIDPVEQLVETIVEESLIPKRRKKTPDQMESVELEKAMLHPKSHLQEYVAAFENLTLPKYQVLKPVDLPKDDMWKVACRVGGTTTTGEAKSKKKAETLAAIEMLRKLNIQ